MELFKVAFSTKSSSKSDLVFPENFLPQFQCSLSCPCPQSNATSEMTFSVHASTDRSLSPEHFQFQTDSMQRIITQRMLRY